MRCGAAGLPTGGPFDSVKSQHRHRPYHADALSTSAVIVAQYVDAPNYVVVLFTVLYHVMQSSEM